MRSKSLLTRPRADEGAAAPAEPRKLATQRPLTLVSSAKAEPAPAKKHGLY